MLSLQYYSLKNCGGFMKMTIIFLSTILGGMAMPASAITWADAKDSLVTATKKIASTVTAKPAYAAGALALGAASWYLYNTYKMYQRTYYIGEQKFVAPAGALVRNRENDATRFAHKRMYYFALPHEQLSKLILANGQKPSNILQVFHNSYDNKSGMRVIIHSNAPYNEEPSVSIGSRTKDLTIAVPHAQSVGRVDYIFMRPATEGK